MNLLKSKGVTAGGFLLTRVLFTNAILELAFLTDVGVLRGPEILGLPL